MRHAGQRQKNLHNHPFTCNKQYIFKPARSSRKHVSSYRSFSVHLELYYFRATHAGQALCRMPVGSAGLRMPSANAWTAARVDVMVPSSHRQVLLIYQCLAQDIDAN